MKKAIIFTLCLLGFSLTSSAEELKLTTPELDTRINYAEVNQNSNAWHPDFSFFKQKTNPGVKPRKFLDDVTFVGVPLFLGGLAIKGDKALFQVNKKADMGGKKNTQLLSDFKTGIDDYLQFFGPVVTGGLKLGGLEGRSDWPRLLSSAGISYVIMAGLVNGIKYTAKEMRPDGSSANSWPSGHTATAFVGATLLHKEYGLTRSPWFSVLGYGVATATGVMRVMNNRHWISDVMSGAGIGILSTELGYAIGDLLFKGKGLLRNDLQMDFDDPSFFSISMGVGLGGKSIDFEPTDMVDADILAPEIIDEENQKEQIQFRAATVVDAEGAYFFNKYIGIGGRLRVRAMSAKTFGQYSEDVAYEDLGAWGGMYSLYSRYMKDDYTSADPVENYYKFFNKIGYNENYETQAPVTDIYGIVKSDHLAEFTSSLGLYINIPLSKHFAIGTKALIGRSFTQDLDIDGHAEGHTKDIAYKMSTQSTGAATGYIPVQTIDYDANGKPCLSYPANTGDTWTDDWDYLVIGAGSSTSYGTGISLTYKYKSNFAWRLFCDYDYTEKDFSLKYDPYHFLKKGVTAGTYTFMKNFNDMEYYMNPVEYKKTKKMNYFTLGLSFMVSI